MKLCILVGNKFLIKKLKFWGQSVHFWSCDITKHGIYRIGHISAIFKDRDFWFGTKNSIKLCSVPFTLFEVINCISPTLQWITLLTEKCQYNLCHDGHMT